MKATHDDIKNCISYQYSTESFQYRLIDGVLYIYCYLTLSVLDKKFTKIPENIVCYRGLDLENTNIKELPDDIVLYGNLYLEGSQIDVVRTHVGGKLHIDSRQHIVIEDGIYIGQKLYCGYVDKYYTLTGLDINGYMMGEGILS